jgi:GNAT superfamily N-acetyltransferase
VEYESTLDPSDEITGTINRGLHAYNTANLGEDVIYNYARVAVVARDEKGQIVGGIHGELVWQWLYIQALWVDEVYRGQGIGTRLLERIESLAVSKGFCNCHLETTDFQALTFYEKNGYTIFGQLEGKPQGTTWYYVKKELSCPSQ